MLDDGGGANHQYAAQGLWEILKPKNFVSVARRDSMPYCVRCLEIASSQKGMKGYD
jgi:hypothetical protein